MKLEDLRKLVDKVDEEILLLLNKRASLSKEIGKIKKEKNLPIFDPRREEEVVDKIVKKNKGPLDDKQLRSIYREILSISRNLQKPLSVAYLGPQATFTHQAAIQRFGSAAEYIAVRSIDAVFREVEGERAEFGVVPIENSTEGVETHTLDMFMESELLICDEVILRIVHSLLSFSSLEHIKRVYSHPQALAQCRGWLEENLPGAEIKAVYSTAGAVEKALSEPESAAIASHLASEIYGVPVVARGIEDKAFNFTRFLVISREECPQTGKDKTSLMFAVRDEVGALFHTLEAFWKFGINMSKIESRPSRRKAWEYYFFVDLEGHREDKKIKDALKELKSRVTFFKVLGSYPRRERE
ncbi:MAG: prephenate dehydratase [Caldiserica bacterium]|nr:prephenate dehydratase [Caldisericota bacterium]